MVQRSLIKEKGTLRLNGISSSDILALLAKRHSADVFVPECKNGETYGRRDLQVIDAWVLQRSYSPLRTIGYEIKCSRQDFEQDQKWTGYLDLCHQFYFVCPAGLIRAADLPNRVGIIWASKDRLHTKRKAERVEPDMKKLHRLLIYIVMSRSDIVDNMYDIGKEAPKPRLEWLREIVEKANDKKELAFFVKGHIREVYENCQHTERSLSSRENQLKDFEARLAKLGITWDSEKYDWQDSMNINNEIELLKKRIDHRTLENMRRTAESLTKLVEQIREYRKLG